MKETGVTHELLSLFLNSDLYFYKNTNNLIATSLSHYFIYKLIIAENYKNTIILEDDNIFKDKALDFITNQLNLIQEDKHKIITVIGPQVQSNFMMAFTTFFFANVDFFLENFNLPTKKEDWYNPEFIAKYSLYKTYEGTFYDLLKDKLDLVLNIEPEFVELHKQDYIEWGIVNRYQNEKYLIDSNVLYLDNLFFLNEASNKKVILYQLIDTATDGLTYNSILKNADNPFIEKVVVITSNLPDFSYNNHDKVEHLNINSTYGITTDDIFKEFQDDYINIFLFDDVVLDYNLSVNISKLQPSDIGLLSPFMFDNFQILLHA
jgi:GR25 family glycosyltransferase involved in LPS biosynthesis